MKLAKLTRHYSAAYPEHKRHFVSTIFESIPRQRHQPFSHMRRGEIDAHVISKQYG